MEGCLVTTTTSDVGFVTSTSLEMSNFLKCLKKEPERRSFHDVQTLYFTLRNFSCLSRYSDDYLYEICEKNCYYMRKSANDILYCRGELAHSWFILVSGSVFIDGSMFLPITSFGRRGNGSISTTTRRPNECLILEPSEMICIDYTDDNNQSQHRHSTHSASSSGGHPADDTSSAYSGSDTMLSSNSATTHSIDLSGLLESVVDESSSSSSLSDSDSESIACSDDLDVPSIRDSIRECLEKDPSERTENDIATLLEFTQHLTAFNDLTLNVRKALCSSMVFAVVEKAGTIVLSHGEELDSWSVLVNGSVEVSCANEVNILSAGDSFGLPPTLDKQYFKGLMTTRVDDCQFVCVTQSDYFRILKQGLDSQRLVKDDEGRTILVYESRGPTPSYAHPTANPASNMPPSYPPSYTPFIVIRGTKPALISELFKQENGSVDPTFVEDFLLTQRIFMDIHELAEQIIIQFNDIGIRDRVTRVMLLWVNNHFIDFEIHHGLMTLLQRFQLMLEECKEGMSGQLRLLQIACSAKSRARTVTLPRASRDDSLPFNIMGGADNGYGVFVSSVEEGSKRMGIRVGDELLSVNNVNFRSINLAKALEILKGQTHLVIVLKCNFLGYHECLTSALPLNSQTSQNSPRSTLPTPNKLNKTLNKHNRFKKALQKINLLPKKSLAVVQGDSTYEEQPKIDFPENVLKIYRPDQTSKFLLVNKETTTREVVMLALQEFPELTSCTPHSLSSRDYGLFQVSVNSVGGTLMVKQGRLPETLDSLAERLQLGARYYIKHVESTEPLVPDLLLNELHKESQVNLLSLNPVELALQLTLEDYACFRQIESTEFIDDLFNLPTPYGTPNLCQFGELVNRETFWVVTEIVKEHQVTKRVQIIKRFIKVALQCKECRNFNSMFAIVSGLGHSAVTRLKITWDKLNSKYKRIFKDLQDLMDPSRNMGKYRNLLASSFQTPMIPFYPVVKKDLTFIHLGNSTHIDEMINFEKMRMVAKEIRQLIQMSAAPFDTSGLACVAAMNQLGNSNGGSNRLTTTTGKGNKNRKVSKRSGLGVKEPMRLMPKKMYEEMNMIRKVKAYLQTLQIISDENLLHHMSDICEKSPSTTTTNPQSNTSTIRRGQSPTLSTTSSASNESSRKKFGSENYQKLLALSEVKSHNQNLTLPHSTTSTAPSNQHKKINNQNFGSTTSIVSGGSSKGEKVMTLSTESSSVLPATKK